MGYGSPREQKNAEDGVVAALLSLHRKKQARLRTQAGDDQQTSVLEHLDARAERLHREHLATERFLEQTLGAARKNAVRHVHQELALSVAPGGTAAGRFRVTNSTPRPAHFELVLGDATPESPRVTVSLSPPRGDLGVNESRVVRVSVKATGGAAGDSVTVPVECRAGVSRERIWLEVEIVGPNAESGDA